MYLLYCDESNLEERADEFFVYGGLAIPSQRALELSEKIARHRRKCGIPPGVLLKFNPAPDGVSHERFIALKQAVITTAIETNCVLLTTIILHAIATSADEARRNAINTVCFHFNAYLNRTKTHGLVLIDRFEDGKIDGHLREKFAKGLTGLPYTAVMPLKNIVGLHYSAIGQSHFSSVIDIVVGSLRFAINAFTRQDNERIRTAGKLLELLAPLFFREASATRVAELGLCFSPKDVRAEKYRERYQELAAFMARHGVVTGQHPTNTRGLSGGGTLATRD